MFAREGIVYGHLMRLRPVKPATVLSGYSPVKVLTPATMGAGGFERIRACWSQKHVNQCCFLEIRYAANWKSEVSLA